MTLQVVKLDPKEYGLDTEKATGIEKSFLPKIVERDGYVSVYENILTKEISKEVCNEAKELGKKLVKVRTGIAEIHKTEKAYYLAAGRFVDALKNKLTLPVEQMESKLEEIAEYFEKQEEQRIENLKVERWAAIKDYTDQIPSGLDTMNDEMFDIVLSGLKSKYFEKIESEKEAERIRLENAAKEKAERERLRLENEALQIQIKKEREDAELRQKAIEAKAKKEREDAERLADIERKKQAEILAKKEAELKAIKDSEIKAENERKEAEIKAKLEAENAAKAPIKKQLSVWVDGFAIAEINIKSHKKDLIIEKFQAFKKWAKGEIDNI